MVASFLQLVNHITLAPRARGQLSLTLTRVSATLQISLLILHGLCAAASNSTCLSAEKVEARVRKFDVNLKKLDLQRDARENQELTTCEQSAQQMHELNGRALSPWRYYIDRNDSRQPRDIIFAECLCKGCIIDGREVNDYNSVEVLAPMLVLIKTKCKDANTYQVQKMRIEVPVGCTCVRPKITK
ncbi:interleukin-17F-like isoform X1 [Pelmatolapia mariae]|uniref:interleukin-17F-like isoform X1 n=1 Tax=Pelmatolapia mariae TaxID=158779 RepID=UPI002FE61525